MLEPTTQGFDTVAEPYRTFAELVKSRNRLVHFQPSIESSASITADDADWAEAIGGVQMTERFFRCVREMVEALHGCGRTSDHLREEDARIEIEQFECDLPAKK